MTTMTKTQNAQPAGTYQPTDIDAKKAAADIRITACDGKFTVISKFPLSGRGVKKMSGNAYLVTRAALGKLENQYSVVCDF